MLADKAAGAASAHDPTIKVENNVAALEAALAEAQERDRVNARRDQVTRLRAKLEKQRGFVADTEKALAEAEKAAAEYREGSV
jgi:hypothetical protein